MEESQTLPKNFRPDMNYRSLRHSSSQVFDTIKKKLSSVEGAVRQRRALVPLENESDRSPSVSPSKESKRSDKPIRRRSKRHIEIVEQGYEFDESSNLMKTPLLQKTPEPRVLELGYSRFSKFRMSMTNLSVLPRALKPSPSASSMAEISPSGRTIKRTISTKIEKIQSPRKFSVREKLTLFSLSKSSDKLKEQLLISGENTENEE